MKLKELNYLSKVCDQILINNKNDHGINAISWLHIINSHPYELKKYSYIFYNNLYYKIFFLKRVIRKYFGWIKVFIISLFSNSSLFFEHKIKRKSFDVLIISHNLNLHSGNLHKDFYYGDILNRLKIKKVNFLLGIFNHSQGNKNNFSKNSFPKIIFSKNIGFSGELKLRKKLNCALKNLKKKYKINKFSIFHKRILKSTMSEARSAGSILNLRVEEQVYTAIKKYDIKKIIVTYEGYAWERFTFYGARRANSKVVCIGYQHAAILKYSHAIYRSLSKKYDPNYIATSGNVGKRLLLKNSNYKQVAFKEFGSVRYTESKINSNFLKSKNKINCIVFPQGPISECKILFNFSIDYCKISNDIHFIWRLHPDTNLSKLKKYYNNFKNLPKNITISNKSLNKDLINSDYALYRGSAAVIMAVNFNVQPIYLDYGIDINIDPLYEINEWKIKINNSKDLLDKIKTYKNKKNFQLNFERKKMINYCKNYYSKIKINEIINLIKK